MNKQKFIEYIRKPAAVTDQTLTDLEQIVEEYPYFQSARTLLAKAAKLKGKKEAPKHIATAATYATDRALLKRYLNDELIFLSPVKIHESHAADYAQDQPTKTIETPPVSRPEQAAPVKIPAESAPESTDPSPEQVERSRNLDHLIEELYRDMEELKVSREKFIEFERKLEEEEAVDKVVKKATTSKGGSGTAEKKSEVKTKTAPKATAAKSGTKKSGGTRSTKASTSKSSGTRSKTSTSGSRKKTTSTASKATSKAASKTSKATSKTASKTSKTTPKSTSKIRKSTTKSTSSASKPKSTSTRAKASTAKKSTSKAKTSAKSGSGGASKTKASTRKSTTGNSKTKSTSSTRSSTASRKTTAKKTAPKKTSTSRTSTTKKASTKSTPKKSSSTKASTAAKKKTTSSTAKKTTSSRGRKSTAGKSTKSRDDKKEDKGDPKTAQQEIITNFIKHNPSITPADGSKRSEEDLSNESTSFHPDIGSEYLAEIYLEQGKTDRALEIYRSLMLKFPKKKSYFAGLIKNLE